MTNLKCLLITALFSLTAAYLYESHYPDTQVERAYVSEKKQPWNEQVSDYKPGYYSEPCLKASDCDPEIGTEGFNPQFNVVDGDVDRRRPPSAIFKRPKIYNVEDGYPINPVGRTGLRGRGSLRRWGPNFLVVYMIERGNEPVEYAIQETNITATSPLPSFPECFMDYPSRDVMSPEIKKALRDVLSSKYNSKYVDHFMERGLRHKYDFWSGYYASQKNTDNAWIELVVYQFADPKYEIFGMADFTPGNNDLHLTWKVINPKKLRILMKQMLFQSKSSFIGTLPRRMLLKHLGKRSNKFAYAFFLFRIALAITGLSVGTTATILG